MTPIGVVPRQRHSTADDLGLLIEFSTRQVILTLLRRLLNYIPRPLTSAAHLSRAHIANARQLPSLRLPNRLCTQACGSM